MFCPNCGTQNNDGVRFCANCGTALTPNVSAAPQAAPMQTPPPAPAPVQPVAPVAPVQPQAVPVSTNPQQKTNVLCIVGLIGSLASIVFLGTTAIVFLILSIIGLISAGKKNEKGKGQAIAGIIISAILVVVWIAGISLGFSGASKYRKKYNEYTRVTTTEREETTRRTTRETTEDTEATTEDTTREETTRETAPETSASGSKNGAYLTTVGNEKTGTVPLTSGKWVEFIEAGGFSSEVTEHKQAKNLENSSIIGLFVLNVSKTPEELAKASMYSMEQAGAKKVTGAHVKIGGYDAIQCYGTYPDGVILVVWYFSGDDGLMRKVTVEFPSTDSSAFHLVENGYKLDR